MKIVALGSGTSQGVPVIGCNCDACVSSDPRDKRLRSSVYVETEKIRILIDIGPDFRQQFLENRLHTVDLILVTHEHNDHVIGIDDIRAINFLQKKSVPVYAENRVLNEIKKRFSYAFENVAYKGLPQIILNEIPYEEFSMEDIDITPIRVMHGNLPILAFRMNGFAYITDANYIDEKAAEQLQGLDVLIINALRQEKHYSHFNLEECIEQIRRLSPSQAFITHISHKMGPVDQWADKLPKNVFPLRDKLVINL